MSVHLGAFLHDPLLLQALVSELLYCLCVAEGLFFRPLPSASPTTQPLPIGTRGESLDSEEVTIAPLYAGAARVAGCLNVASMAGTDVLF